MKKFKRSAFTPRFERFRFNNNDFRIRQNAKNQSYAQTDYIYFDDYNKTLAFLAISTPLDNRTLDNMYFELVEKLTKSLITSLSKTTFKFYVTEKNHNLVLEKGYTILIDDFGNEYYLITPNYANACMDIVNSGFTQEIYNDILQEIACNVWQMYLNNHCKVVYNFITKDSDPIFVFDYYTTNRGNIKSYKYKLFQAIENCLYKFSNHSNYSNGMLLNIDSFEKAISPFLENDDNKLTSQNINAYLKAIKNHNKFEKFNVLARTDIQDFFNKCSNDFTDKHILKMKYVLSKLVDGYTTNQIHELAQKDDIQLSVANINKIRLELRELWEKYGCKVNIYEYELDNGYITYHKPIEYYGKCESNSYIVESKNDSYMKVSDKPTSPYNPHDSIINTDIVSLVVKDTKDCLALKKALKNNKLVNQKSNYAQWAIPYGEKCSQYKESLYYMLDSQNWLDSYLSDIRTTNNYSVKCVKTQKGIDTYYNNQLIRHTNYITK